MQSNFQFVALARENFEHLFSMNDVELATVGARRLTVDENVGYPCRVSLMDAPVGERVILTPFQHHEADSPYRSSGPIFVRESAKTAKPEVNEIPVMFHHRMLSVRAYDQAAMMRAGRVIEGHGLEEAIKDLFTKEDIAYLHLHNAGAGCFNCLVQRA
jgi:Protein of unknown function (DUF1203)